MRGVHLERKLEYTEKAGVVASRLSHRNQYVSNIMVRIWCPSAYPWKLNHKNLFKEKFANP